MLGAGVAIIAILGASALYGSQPHLTFAAAKSRAVSGLASAVDVLGSRLEAITGQKAREEERSEMRDLNAALTQVTVRLDQIEHDYGARLDKLGERVDQNSSKAAVPAAPASELANVVARLDKLEKKAAVPAPTASEFADVVAKLNSWKKSSPPSRKFGRAQSRLPRRNNRRSWRGRNLPPRTRPPDPTTRGLCSGNTA